MPRRYGIKVLNVGAPASAPILTLDTVAASIPSWLIVYSDVAVNDYVELQRSTDNFSTFDSYTSNQILSLGPPVTAVSWSTGAWDPGSWEARIRIVRSGVNGNWSNEEPVTINAAGIGEPIGFLLTLTKAA